MLCDDTISACHDKPHLAADTDAEGPLRGASELGSTELDIGEEEKAASPPPIVEEAKPKKTHRRNRSLTALLPTLKAKPKKSTDEVCARPHLAEWPVQNACGGIRFWQYYRDKNWHRWMTRQCLL